MHFSLSITSNSLEHFKPARAFSAGHRFGTIWSLPILSKAGIAMLSTIVHAIARFAAEIVTEFIGLLSGLADGK